MSRFSAQPNNNSTVRVTFLSTASQQQYSYCHVPLHSVTTTIQLVSRYFAAEPNNNSTVTVTLLCSTASQQQYSSCHVSLHSLTTTVQFVSRSSVTRFVCTAQQQQQQQQHVCRECGWGVGMGHPTFPAYPGANTTKEEMYVTHQITERKVITNIS